MAIPKHKKESFNHEGFNFQKVTNLESGLVCYYARQEESIMSFNISKDEYIIKKKQHQKAQQSELKTQAA